MLGDPCRAQAQGDRCDRRSVRPLHPVWHSRSHPLRQRTGVRGQGRAGMDRVCRCQDRLHRAGQSLGEWLHRELQRAPCADHEGTRTGRIQTWDGKKWNIASDWITADDSVIAPMVKEAAAKYAAEKKITTGCLMTN